MTTISTFSATGLLLSATLLLGSCVSKPTKENAPRDWQSRQAALAEIYNWKMHARIALRSKDHSGSATLIWIESVEQRNLRLLGPLGGGLMSFQQDATGVSIQDSKAKVWHAEDASELITRVTGWQIPVTALRWWLLGLTEPGSNAEYTLDDRNRLATVQQSSWKVSLDKYRLFENYELPSSILIENVADQEDARYIRIKIVVKDWEIE